MVDELRDDAASPRLMVALNRDGLKGRAGRLVGYYSQNVGKEGNSANSTSARYAPNVSFVSQNAVA